jgi:hypothetical protein
MIKHFTGFRVFQANTRALGAKEQWSIINAQNARILGLKNTDEAVIVCENV